ncbi:MAG: hypothetical protein JF619_23460 [Massilia sp.]|nr:hypothetical protein [Massilia sp.]
MTRLLFWIALVILVVAAVRSKLRAAIARAQGPAEEPAPAAAGNGAAPRRVQDESEAMTCCAHCGIYFPSSEAVRAGGRDYCSPAHVHQETR